MMTYDDLFNDKYSSDIKQVMRHTKYHDYHNYVISWTIGGMMTSLGNFDHHFTVLRNSEMMVYFRENIPVYGFNSGW